MGLALSQSRSDAARSVLERLRSTSFARAVLLLEKDGGISMAVGDATDLDLTPFSVLSAACVSAGQELEIEESWPLSMPWFQTWYRFGQAKISRASAVSGICWPKP